MAYKKWTKTGMPQFVPTQEQRNFVAANAGFRMTWDELASLIINPRTNAPISKETLGKHFRAELDTGKQRLKAMVAAGYLARLAAGEWNAISFGLRHFHGYKDEATLRASAEEGDGSGRKLTLEFVLPDKREDG